MSETNMQEHDQVQSPPVIEVEEEVEVARPKKKFDKGFVRNVKILGGVLSFCVALAGYFVWKSMSMVEAAKDKNMPGQTVIAAAASGVEKNTEQTPAEAERLNQLNQRQAQAATESGKTFIPRELPMSDQENAGGNHYPAGEPGAAAGRGQPTRAPGANMSQQDQEEQKRFQAGIERQLNRAMDFLEPVGTTSAAAYASKSERGEGAGSAAAAAGQGHAQPAALNTIVVPGMEIVGAELTSPLDTGKTPYVSVRISTGAMTGALLIGSAQYVGEDGVQMTFNRMRYGSDVYAINAVGLDQATSSRAMEADFDRRILAKYVIPILSVTGSAYMRARAQPDQQVLTSQQSQIVVTPAATAKQAAAAGIAAGIERLGASVQAHGPDPARLPVGTSLGIMFLDPVIKKGTN